MGNPLSPALQVKQIILGIAGDDTTKPADLPDGLQLKANLNFGDDEYSLLQAKLDELVSALKAGASIDDDETVACDTVGDCVKLVTSKTND